VSAARCVLGLTALACALACALANNARAQETSALTASSAMYIRSDTDHTTVYTPRVTVGAPLAESTRVDLVYTVDVWTSASIDIRTSASKAVTEQRDEIDVALEQAFPDLTVGASYRYSTEYDYESHGGSLGAAYDFADKSANLALTGRLYLDTIGRAGDPGFMRDASQMNARAAFTQVIDPDTFAQLVYELGVQRGFLSSPYRYVRIADDQGLVPSTCVLPVMSCLLEENPGARTRHAVALHARRALGEPFSLGASYRFYLDDWQMTSHTISLDGAWTPADAWLVGLAYRLYTQSSADHYKPFYAPKPMPEHFTSDKELSALTSHRLELELSHTFELDEMGSALDTVLLLAPSYFLYHDFLPLDSISAFEATLGVEVRL
jgi:hypothetical protein